MRWLLVERGVVACERHMPLVLRGPVEKTDRPCDCCDPPLAMSGALAGRDIEPRRAGRVASMPARRRALHR